MGVTEIKALIKGNITDKTPANKITPAVHGATEAAIVDFAKAEVDAVAAVVATKADASALAAKADASDLAAKAPVASPAFTGDAKGVTPAVGDNDTSLATTAFVKSAIAAALTGIAKPYKILYGLLNNANGTFVFTPTTNELGGVFDAGAPGDGNFIITNDASPFTNKKTLLFIGGTFNNDVNYTISRDSTNQISISQFYQGFLNPGTHMTDVPLAIIVSN